MFLYILWLSIGRYKAYSYIVENINIQNMKVFEYKTKVTVARPNSTSGRTTVPKEVMGFLDLKIGDSVNWVVEYEAGKTTVRLEKSE